WYLAASSPIALPSIGLGWNTAPKPLTIGSHSVTVEPNEWEEGSTPTMTSLFRRSKTCETLSMLASTLRWLSMTPLGTPVLPLENTIVASDEASPSAA